MADSPPPTAQALVDSDAALRHRPEIVGDTPPSSSASAPIGAAWRDPGSSEVLRGERKAGGPDADHPHIFHLADVGANVFPGGGLQGGHEGNWPILKGQNAAIYLARLEPGGVREPHWHPSAWEMNFVLQGQVRWSFVGPNSTQEAFTGGKGDVVFAPQGHLHYFENASDTEDLLLLIVFNASAQEPDDDIGIVQSLKAMPADVLAAVFGGSPEVFANLPGKSERVVIAKKQPAPS